MKAIAQEAGISIMTASRALNGTGHVAKDTAERIRQIANRHKYRPNLLIRGVQTGCTMNIGVIFPADIGFYTEVLAGIHDTLLKHEYSIQLSLIKQHLGELAIRQEHQQLLRLLDLRVDGIILRPVNDDASDIYFKEVFERGVPLVTIDRNLEKVHCDFVGSNDFEAGQQAATFLMSKGHRKFLLVASGDIVSTGRDRRDGFLSIASKTKDVEVSVINETDFEYHDDDVLAALKNNPEITAAFCVKDSFAAGLYNTVLKSGFKIPKDISILGFGNLDMGPYLNPPLSTFDQHPVELGNVAAKLLLKRIQHSPAKLRWQNKIIPADILNRQSIATL
ncbi:MAG: LacI family DNA-binding transcriptional regulator [Kiritimatiellales bacterium]